MTPSENDLNTTSPLSAHDVYQVLTDIALSECIMIRSSIQPWNEIYHDLMPLKTSGWQLILFNDCDALGYC